MKKLALLFLLSFGIYFSVSAQNLNELSALDAVTGSSKSLGTMSTGKATVLIFHSLNCPFAKMYDARIKSLRASYQNLGIVFALVNPESGGSPDEQLSLRSFIDQSGLNMPYLVDVGQSWTKLFQVTKIPEVILLVPGANGLEIAYRGALDNNPQAESAVTEKYLERAINQVLKKESPSPGQVRAVGCNVRTY